MENPPKDHLKTRASLLARLAGEPAETDWQDFFHQYEGPVMGFVIERTKDHCIARDTFQSLMIYWMKRMRKPKEEGGGFDYDPSQKFRGYIFAMARSHMLKILNKRKRLKEDSIDDAHASTGQSPLDRMKDDAPQSADTFTAEEEETFRRRVLIEALRRELDANKRVKEQTIEIFLGRVLDHKSPKELAEEFDTNENNVNAIVFAWKAKAQLLVAEYLESIERDSLGGAV